VLDYYDRHLDPKIFGRMLRGAGPALVELIVVGDPDEEMLANRGWWRRAAAVEAAGGDIEHRSV